MDVLKADKLNIVVSDVDTVLESFCNKLCCCPSLLMNNCTSK